MRVLGKTTPRRRVLAWALGPLAALVPVLSSRASLAVNRKTRRRETLHKAMLAVFRNQDAACTIGKRYLADHPEEGDWKRLADDLFGREPLRRSARGVRGILTRRRHDDFANDRCVLVDNWILARAEAQACALVVLLREAGA
jgi:hypothetical protein